MSYSGEAQEKREMAARARRLAGSVTLEADRERLIRTAKQLEKEAQELQNQAEGRDANPYRPPSRKQP
jgi:hypothetical protein